MTHFLTSGSRNNRYKYRRIMSDPRCLDESCAETIVSHQETREFADFCDYCAEGSITDVRMALKKTPSLVDIRDKTRMTALKVAIRYARYDVFKLLVKYDAYTNKLNIIKHIGAMPNAKEKDYLKIFKYIHSTFKVSTKSRYMCLKNALVNNYRELYRAYANKYGVTLKNIYKIYCCNKNIVRTIVKLGWPEFAPLMSSVDCWRAQVLKNHIVAAMYSHPDQRYNGIDSICDNFEKYAPGVFRALAAVGANVDRALFYAANHAQLSAARAILEGGADPNAHNSYEITALRAAIRKSSPSMVKLLLEAGANPSDRIVYGCTDIEYAIQYEYPGIVELLLEYGAKPDISFKSKVVDLWTSTPRSLKFHVQGICEPNNNPMLMYRNSYELETIKYF